MKKLFLAALLFCGVAATTLGQGLPVWVSWRDSWKRWDGGPVLSVVDYSAVQTANLFLGAPCGSNGAPTFRLFCDGDNLILGQASSPGTAQALFNNFNIGTGTGIATQYELPLNGIVRWTAASRLKVLADGTLGLGKSTGDNTFTICSMTSGSVTNSSATSCINLAGSGLINPLAGNGNAGAVSTNGLRLPHAAKTNAGSPYTLTLFETNIQCDASGGAVTLNLPATVGSGHIYEFIKIDTTANTCTIHPSGSNTLLGSQADVVLSNFNETVRIVDRSGSSPNHWVTMPGSDVTDATTVTMYSLNRAAMIYGQASELLVLSTVGLTTDTTANLLPAGAIIDAVVTRITVTITNSTNWAVGDGTTVARFSAANATKTAGTTQVGIDQWSGAVTTLAAGPSQAAAAKVRITTTGTQNNAGTVRITVFYHQYVAPTS